MRWPIRGSNFNTRDYGSSVQAILADVETVIQHTLRDRLGVNPRDYKVKPARLYSLPLMARSGVLGRSRHPRFIRPILCSRVCEFTSCDDGLQTALCTAGVVVHSDAQLALTLSRNLLLLPTELGCLMHVSLISVL